MVLFAVLMTTQVLRLLNQAASGVITPDAVIALLGFSALGSLPVVLTVTIFMAVLLTFSRWYRDSEMVIWLSAGMPLTQWFGPVLRFAMPVVLVVAALSLFLTPWAGEKSRELRKKIDKRDDTALVTPGAFSESSNADRVFFVESLGSAAGEVRNVFVSTTKEGRTSVIATESGHTEISPDGDQFLVLQQGRRYELPEGESLFQVMQFERYAVRISSKEIDSPVTSAHAMATQDLIALGTNIAQAELLWRVGVPISAVILALLAVPLSYVNPRVGRAGNLVMALLIYMIYSNLLGVSEAWVAQGRLKFSVGVWAIHAMMLVVTVGFIAVRTSPSPWRWRRRA